MYSSNGNKKWVYFVVGLLLLAGVVVFASMRLMVAADGSTAAVESSNSYSSAPENIDDPLLKYIEANLDEIITVIVQKQGNDNEPEALVVSLGGTIVKDLPIIKSFAAELDGRSIIELASSPSVKHISPDAPIDASQKGN